MANSGTPRESSAPGEVQSQLPTAPAAEGASIAPKTPSLVAHNSEADDAPPAIFADEPAVQEVPVGQLRNSGEIPSNKQAPLAQSQTRQSGHSSSQQAAAQRRLALLIAKETATLSAADDVFDSATSEASRTLPTEEPNTFPPRELKESIVPQYPPAPPLPTAVSDSELSGENPFATESANSVETTKTDAEPARLEQDSTPNALEIPPSAEPVQLEPQTPTAQGQVLLGGNAPQPLSPPAGNQQRLDAKPNPRSSATQADTPKKSADSNPPGRVLLHRYRPGLVNQFFYGW